MQGLLGTSHRLHKLLLSRGIKSLRLESCWFSSNKVLIKLGVTSTISFVLLTFIPFFLVLDSNALALGGPIFSCIGFHCFCFKHPTACQDN